MKFRFPVNLDTKTGPDRISPKTTGTRTGPERTGIPVGSYSVRVFTQQNYQKQAATSNDHIFGSGWNFLKR